MSISVVAAKLKPEGMVAVTFQNNAHTGGDLYVVAGSNMGWIPTGSARTLDFPFADFPKQFVFVLRSGERLEFEVTRPMLDALLAGTPAPEPEPNPDPGPQPMPGLEMEADAVWKRHIGKGVASAVTITCLVILLGWLAPLRDQGVATLAAVQKNYEANTDRLLLDVPWEIDPSYVRNPDGSVTLRWRRGVFAPGYALVDAVAHTIVDGKHYGPLKVDRVEDGIFAEATLPPSLVPPGYTEVRFTYTLSNGTHSPALQVVARPWGGS